MDLKSYVEPRGRLTELAGAIEAQPQLVGQWANEIRPVPALRCPSIEQATDGTVTVEELRPDLVWVRVPDKAWPHHKGRPLWDLAKVAA